MPFHFFSDDSHDSLREYQCLRPRGRFALSTSLFFFLSYPILPPLPPPNYTTKLGAESTLLEVIVFPFFLENKKVKINIASRKNDACCPTKKKNAIETNSL